MTGARASRGASTGRSLTDRASVFFGTLNKDISGRRLLEEQDHRIEFDLTDAKPFYVAIHGGGIRVHEGMVMPRCFDDSSVVHFKLSSNTLRRLFDGKIRFTDALIPTSEDGKDAMLLLECTLFKWSVLNWVGRMFRGAQIRQKTSGNVPKN